MSKDTVKATVSLKAESMSALTNALESIAERATMQIVLGANVSVSIAIESDDADDLSDALSAIARAVSLCEGIEASAKAPMTAWNGRRLDATPMERMINGAAPLESVTLSHNGRSVTLNAQTKRNAAEMLAKSWTPADDDQLFSE